MDESCVETREERNKLGRASLLVWGLRTVTYEKGLKVNLC